jgi:uncharacterized phage-associated protein
MEGIGGLQKVVDVAEYILLAHGPMTTMKLHKLLYYSQAHHLVTRGEPMFDLDFQAWATGPVIPELFELHRGRFLIRHGELYKALEERMRDEGQSHDGDSVGDCRVPDAEWML